jgi:hypothetical protein
MIVRGCKIRENDGIRVNGKVLIVSSVQADFESVGIFARPIGRGKAHDVLVFVDREALVEIIRDRKGK